MHQLKNKKPMNKTDEIINGIVVLLCLLTIIGWFLNIIRLFGCDFASPYRCEVIHGIGLIAPPAASVTGWMETGR